MADGVTKAVEASLRLCNQLRHRDGSTATPTSRNVHRVQHLPEHDARVHVAADDASCRTPRKK